MRFNKVVLAYSGGLDTSVIAKWLMEKYNCEVITFTADIGQGAETKDAKIGDIFKNAQSVVDNMANKGVIHKNKAARIKSRLNKKVKSA